jgi:hypothetical protein
LKRKQGDQIELTDIQEGLTPSIDGLAGENNRPMVNRESVDGKEKAGIKRIRQRQGTTEAGQSVIDNESRVSFRRV